MRPVVKESAYTTDLETLKAAKDVPRKHYDTGVPAAPRRQVVRLFQPEYGLEVEVVAVRPEPGEPVAP